MKQMTIQRLWATPLWQIDLALGKEHNEALLMALRQPRHDSASFNLFERKDQAVNLLEASIGEAVDQALSDAGYDLRFQQIGRGWTSVLHENEWDTPHTHFGTAMVGVYYPQVPPGSGALWLLDPRGNAPFGEVIGGKDGRVGHRIEPREGLLVLFPSDVIHFVEPHRGTIPRISLGINIRLKRLS